MSIDERLRESLRRVAGSTRADDAAWRAIERRLAVERRRRSIARTVGAVLVAAAVVVPLVWVGVELRSRAGHGGPVATPGPTVVRPPAHGMPGLVQVAASAFPTAGHGVVLIQQCHPCRARGGTYTTWSAVTDDGGASWVVRRASLPVSVGSFQMGFAGPKDGWAQGGYVTHDGGLTWTKATAQAHWPGDSVSVADGAVWAMADGCGNHGPWGCGTTILVGPAAESTLVPSEAQPFSGYEPGRVLAASGVVVYIDAVGPKGSVLVATHDGGLTWQQVSEPCPAGDLPLGLAADGPSSLWSACRVGVSKPGAPKPIPGRTDLLARSTDGGRDWSTLPNPLRLSALDPVSPTVAWGFDGIGGIARTTDGGQTWQRVWEASGGTVEAFSAESPLRAEVTVAFSPPSGTYLVVDRTTDGGRTWQPRIVALPAR